MSASGTSSAQQADTDRALIWDLVETARVAMMVTHGGEQATARPMYGQPDRESEAIWFITKRHSGKVDEAKRDQQVLLTYVDGGNNRYLSLHGTVEIVDDRARLEQLWTPWATLFFPRGAGDPEAVLLRFHPEHGEYWTGSNNMPVRGFRAAGDNAQMGEHGRVQMGERG